MSRIQIQENLSLHPVKPLPRRCLDAINVPWPLGKRMTLILLMIFMLSAAQAQTLHRDSFYNTGQSITSANPLYVRTAVSPQGNLRYSAEDLGLTRSPIKIVPYEPGLKLTASRQKIAGISMVTLGGALQIAGLVVMAEGINDLSPDNGEGEGEMLLGVVMFAGGTAVAVPGVFLWAKGTKNYKRALASQQSLKLNFSPMPSLRYRF
jgi:hypothetical protein